MKYWELQSRLELGLRAIQALYSAYNLSLACGNSKREVKYKEQHKIKSHDRHS